MNKFCLSFLFLLSFVLCNSEPRIKFIKNYLNIGEFPDSIKSTEFEVLYCNIGDSPLYLTELKAFCPCIETEFSTDALLPGDTTSFYVRYTFKHTGDFDNAIRLYYNSEEEGKFASFTFLGKVN